MTVALALVVGALAVRLLVVTARDLLHVPALERRNHRGRIVYAGSGLFVVVGVLLVEAGRAKFGAFDVGDPLGADPARGAVLSAVYALGLGLPFILLGLAYSRALRAIAFVRRHQVWVTRFGGLMLVVVGILLVTGWWDTAVTWIQIRLITDYEVSV